MEESKTLEAALKSCQLLEHSLHKSIKVVRRLNMRYNLEWFVENYNAYIASIWAQSQCLGGKEVPPPTPPTLPLGARLSRSISHSGTTSRSHKLSTNLALSTRSSNELFGSNRKINYKFLKIKRGMEALLVQLQHAIEISNRQRNFIHLNVNGRDSKIRVCCH